jgi:hypothetical protein
MKYYKSRNGSRLEGRQQGKRDNAQQVTRQGGQDGLMLTEGLHGPRRGSEAGAAMTTWCWAADSRFTKMQIAK